MSTGMASDEVIDLIAEIELQRQKMAKEGGLPSACSGALRRLHELLDRETKAAQGEEGRHIPNIEALKNEIERVKKLGGVTARGAMPKGAQPNRGPLPRKDAPRSPKDRVRRTMGRGSR